MDSGLQRAFGHQRYDGEVMHGLRPDSPWYWRDEIHTSSPSSSTYQASVREYMKNPCTQTM